MNTVSDTCGGSEFYEKTVALINDFNAAGKAIGAICISPVILSKAGILNGRKRSKDVQTCFW